MNCCKCWWNESGWMGSNEWTSEVGKECKALYGTRMRHDHESTTTTTTQGTGLHEKQHAARLIVQSSHCYHCPGIIALSA